MDEDWKIFLGCTYGGPSISFEPPNKFVAYEWGDAPVSDTILAEADTIDELLAECKIKHPLMFMKIFLDDQRHLVTFPYTEANLHLAAESLRIKRQWFHSGDKFHYDVPKRTMPRIINQVNLVSPKDIVRIIRGLSVEEVYCIKNLSYYKSRWFKRS